MAKPKKGDAPVERSKGTMVAPCGCTSAFQDRRYGRGLRLMNKSGTKSGQKCTVCGVKHGAGAVAKPIVAKAITR
jgi:hypothetical protein